MSVATMPVIDLTGELPDEQWRAVDRNDRPCGCGGGYEHFWNEGNGRLLVCHRGPGGALLCGLVFHTFWHLTADPLGEVQDHVAAVAHGEAP